MTNSTTSAMLPFLYMVWSDDLLTEKEFDTLQDFVNKQQWLSPLDKKELTASIVKDVPPSRETISKWYYQIQEVVQSQSGIKTIFDVVLFLSNNNQAIIDNKLDFVKLEADLGILSEEFIGNFKKIGNTQTARYQNTDLFNIKSVTKLLDGEQAPIINRVKEVISRPEFAYIHTTDTAVYREKVYEWCKILADENLGNMAYPQEHGGGDNIVDYFAIMVEF